MRLPINTLQKWVYMGLHFLGLTWTYLIENQTLIIIYHQKV